MSKQSILVLAIVISFAVTHCAHAVELLVAEARGADYVLWYDAVTGNYLGKFSIEGSDAKQPTAMVWGPDDNLYVAVEYGTDRVVRFDGITGQYLGVFGEASSNFGQLQDPTAMVYIYPYPKSRQKFMFFKVDSSPVVKAVGTEGARRATGEPTATLYTSAWVR